MVIAEHDPFPRATFLPTDLATLVKVTVKRSFLQTVQGRGAPSRELNSLRLWLIKHLGVFYRGYLEQDPETYDTSGIIVVSIDDNALQIRPLPVPIAKMELVYFTMELGGKVYQMQYR